MPLPPWMDWSPQTSWCAACAGAVAVAAAAVRGAVAARGTTALPAAVWAAAAALALAVDGWARASGATAEPSAAAGARLTTVALSVCPAMSLLGAKRPQHGVWQFIVGALAAILVLPALATLATRPGSVPDPHLLGRAFVGVLLLVGGANFLGTRAAIPATVATAGMAILARGFLPWSDTESSFPPGGSAAAAAAAATDALASWAVAVSAWGAALRSPPPRPPPGTFAAGIEPAWLALRDTLGIAWSLRIAERFDELAAGRGWPCRLGLGGVVPREASPVGPWQADARRALGALLRRFVSAAWLARHRWPGDPAAELADGEDAR